MLTRVGLQFYCILSKMNDFNWFDERGFTFNIFSIVIILTLKDLRTENDVNIYIITFT